MLRRAAILVLLALPAMAPGGPPAHAHPPGELDRIEAEIRQKRKQIEHAEARAETLLEAIAGSDARRESVSASIADLTASLASAEGRLRLARSDLREARGYLERWTERLADRESDFAERRDDLTARAATAYKLGPGGYLDLVLGSSDLSALSARVAFVEDVLVADAETIHGVDVARELVESERARVEDVEQRLAASERRARRERDRVARIKARQEALRAAIESEIALRRDLLGDVEETKAAYEAAVAELEAESAEIRGLIQSGGSTGGGSGQLARPVDAPVSSGFGWRTHPIFGTRRFHGGVDFDADCGVAIRAAEGGTVISAGWRGGYGLATIIDHGDGLSTLYAHQSSIGVGEGAEVSRGATIGAVGTTGWSTGCHLHFEVRVNGSPVDPMPYLG